jgi:hypothetical protein
LRENSLFKNIVLSNLEEVGFKSAFFRYSAYFVFIIGVTVYSACNGNEYQKHKNSNVSGE